VLLLGWIPVLLLGWNSRAPMNFPDRRATSLHQRRKAQKEHRGILPPTGPLERSEVAPVGLSLKLSYTTLHTTPLALVAQYRT
jgi:hypothetical protein